MFSILSFFSADEESNDHHDGKGGRGSAMHTAQTLFPSTMCSAFVEVIRLLDDHAVSLDGVAVYEIAYQVRRVFHKMSGRTALFSALR